MGLFLTLLLLATGVWLPSFDVYSDICFATKLFTGSYKREGCSYARPHPKFASAMLAPVLLSWIFVAKQWYQTEQGMKQKLVTFPLLILQFYPQYRALRVLYHAKWRKTNGWQRMKDAWELEISHLGAVMLLNMQHFAPRLTLIICFRALSGVCAAGSRTVSDLGVK